MKKTRINQTKNTQSQFTEFGAFTWLSHWRSRSLSRHRSKKGDLVAELASAMVILVPIVAIFGYVAVEAQQAFTIYNALNQSAYIAARQLAIAYMQNPKNTMAYPSSIINVQYLNLVNNTSQFSIPANGWKTSSNPPTVTVVCTYQSGLHGNPQFPNPDLLNLGPLFVLQSQATCRLE